MVVTIEEKEKKVMKIDKYPEGLDNMDKTIWDILAENQKSMSVNTLRNKIRDNMIGNFYEFVERLQRLSKIANKDGYSELQLWKENKETLQIGKKKNETNNN